ncbi:ataxin-1-like isoform X2 [Megalobrama amblycephala]|uniref:ataxin-1-like isoform X2 n=1 Tax=Megalobrama amblycephala TaxID=75352 RepID=UPI002013EF41|nr:ataxin-1-like isoform X2 [Megalobrama amblycephala]
MKPVHERNQECLPPKKRDLPVNNNNNNTSTNNNSSSSISGGAGGSGIGSGGGGEDGPSSQSSGVSGEGQSGSGEWVRAQPSVHYGVEGAEGLIGVPVDQYSMLYKVALPAGTYSPTSLHPVLSHISPAYNVPSSVLQHTSVPYPPHGYTQIPHSSLQFVSSPYATAVPYALPPGFVPSPLMPPQSAISQPHLVPYPSVIQEGVVSSPPQQQVSYTKMLPSEQAAALGTVGMLSAGELSPRGVPVFYNPAVRGVQPQRDLHSSSLEQEREVNGGDRDHGGRESHQDAVYSARSARMLQAAALEAQQDKSLKSRRPEGRMSPGQSSTPDTDLEVQQVVGRLASPVHGTSRKEAAHVPLNLSQSSQRSRETQSEVRTAYALNPAESRAHQQHIVQQGHAVILANGQPVLVPLDYHHHQQQQQQQQQHYQSNDVASPAIVASQATYTKAMDAAACLPERAVAELPPQHGQQLPTPTPGALPQAPLLAPTGPSHFMKGAIIQLATGELKRVEDLQTQDFVRSAEVSGGLKIDSSMVVDIRASQRPGLVALHFNVGEQQSKVTIDVPPEHPFFVFGQGWSSCSPERTAQLYGLTCHHLQVGDVCVSVTLQQQAALQQKPPQQMQARTPTKANSTSGAPPQPMGPPAPQHTPRPPNQLKMERIHRERDRDKEETMQVGGLRHIDAPPRPNRTSAEHTRSQSNYYLHTEGHAPPGTGAGASSVGASQRRWSAPGFQRYSIKNEDGSLASAATSSSSRPSFIPQEVKLSIEGRSNAGK